MTASQTLRPGWTPITIGLMILGFIAWWPLGLAMLAYIVWGDRLHDALNDTKREFAGKRACGPKTGYRGRNATGNAAFDEYRAEELERLKKERQRLDDEVKEFEDYLSNLHKARDKEEFDRFMAERDKNRKARNKDNDIDDAEVLET